MNILLTGGAGFIGSNLAGFLLEKGHRVRVLDDFSTGREENIREFAKLPAFELVRGDIRDEKTVLSAMSGIDAVSHQAAIGSVPRSIKDPVSSLSVNICGFANILDAAVKCGVKRVVYASSSSVYGDCGDDRKREDRIGAPLSPYAISKYADELLAHNWAELFGLELIGLRYFNVFGPKQSPDGPYAAVIPRFCMALLAHKSPVINGDGSVVRDFTYVENVLQANYAALTVPPGTPGVFGKVCNIAGGEQMTIADLFEKLRCELARFDGDIASIEAVHGPDRPGDIPRSLADISLAEKLLDYKVSVRAEEGLPLTAKWYFEHGKRFGYEQKA